MGTFWTVLGFLLLGLLVLVLLLLLLPVSLLVEFKQERLTVKLRILFLTFPLYPRRKKASEEPVKVEQVTAPAAEENLRAEQAVSLDGDEPKPRRKITLSDLTKFVSSAGRIMRIVLKLIQIRDIRIVYPIRGEDAAQTAIQYGRFHAYLGSTLGVLQNFLNMRFKQVDILPDFNNNCKYRRYFYCKLQAIPFIIVIAALYALARLKGDKLI